VSEVHAFVVVQNGGDVSLVERGMLDPSSVRSAETEVVVDVSAMNLLLPQEMVESLGLTKRNGTINGMRFAGPLLLTAVGRTMTTDCVIGLPECQPRLGQIVLSCLDLVADRTEGQLTVNPESPFRPMIKMK